MNKLFSIFIISIGFYTCKAPKQSYIIEKGNVVYDFSFAELSIKFLENGDTSFINKIAELDASKHLQNHAKQFGYDVPKDKAIELVKYLLFPIDEKKLVLEGFKRNLKYAKKSIAEKDIAQTIALQYLPKDFTYSSHLFFTFGYDLGVAYQNNASINLAHPHYIENMQEIKYYSIHELHHAGFIKLKNNLMPSLDIVNYGEMATLIEYFTHLEGMGTFAPLELRKKENAMETDKDYIALQDNVLIIEYEKEYFDIYFHFKNNPDRLITEEDWEMVNVLSDQKRLWYRVGALIAKTIDDKLGREKLVSLIPEPSENFIKTYLKTKE